MPNEIFIGDTFSGMATKCNRNKGRLKSYFVAAVKVLSNCFHRLTRFLKCLAPIQGETYRLTPASEDVAHYLGVRQPGFSCIRDFFSGVFRKGLTAAMAAVSENRITIYHGAQSSGSWQRGYK